MRKKKVLIDAVSLLSSFTGIGRYTYENSLKLKNLDSQTFEWFFNYGHHSKELFDGTNKKENFQKLKKIKKVLGRVPFMKSVARKALHVSTKLYSRSYDLYWQPNFIPQPHIRAKFLITTVHDFSFYLQPSWHPKERIEYFKKNFFINVQKSDHIITGSNFSKQEIIKYLKFPEEKITVIHHGVDHNLYKVYPKKILEKTQKKFQLPKSFILFVGSIEPRKNLITLLRAYTKLSKTQKNKTSLVLVGFKGWENKEVMNIITKEKEHIKYLGYVTNKELPHIYNLATIFVYPTYYEGFGIPPLESFACGTPVIVSNVASLPEVCDDCVLYINPDKQDELKDAIEILLKDENLQEVLREKGLKQAQKFSWEDSARKHLELFKKTINLFKT